RFIGASVSTILYAHTANASSRSGPCLTPKTASFALLYSRNWNSARNARFPCLFPRRGVAQPGRAPGSGPGGRRFKSSLPDQYLQQLAILASCWGTQRGTHSLLTESG